MTAHRKSYREYVNDDLDVIEVRAMTLYALKGTGIPWDLASDSIREQFRDRASRELWEEGALRLDPSEPYYEATDTMAGGSFSMTTTERTSGEKR